MVSICFMSVGEQLLVWAVWMKAVRLGSRIVFPEGKQGHSSKKGRRQPCKEEQPVTSLFRAGNTDVLCWRGGCLAEGK